MENKIVLLSVIALSINSYSQSVGIGSSQFVPKSTLDVNGGVTIGTGYAGVYAAPANGLNVQGNVGIGVGAPGGIISPLTIGYYSPTAGFSPAVYVAYTPQPSSSGTYNDAFEAYFAGFPPANDPTGIYDGFHSIIQLGNTTVGKVAGVYNQTNSCCTSGTVSSLYGTLNTLNQISGNQTVNSIYGTSNTIGTGSSIAGSSTGYGTYTTFGGKITSVYGDYVTAAGSGSITNAYGIYVTDLSLNATTAYGVYCAGNQMNYFGGNVGIGTLSPTSTLQVNGNGSFSGTVTASCGTLSCSDIRYKKDIVPLSNVLGDISKLCAVTYYWKNTEFPAKNFTNSRQIGIIAQDLEKVYPELVSTDDQGYKSVDYAKFTPVLLEAIQELKAENDSLKQEIETIKTTMSASSH